MARPTDYTPELLEKAKAYLERAKENKDFYPSIAELALELDLARKTIYDWASQEEKKEFCNIVDDILALQEVRLSENGLMGKYNPTIAKLMLTKHGYSDKQDLTSGGKELPTPIFTNVPLYNGNPEDSES